MTKIFIGLLFLCFDFNVSGISVTPAFVGYILIYIGVGEFSQLKSLEGKRPWIALAAGVALLGWLPVWVGADLISMLLAFVSLAFQLWVTYQLVLMVEELEQQVSAALYSDSLHARWIVMAVGMGLATLLSFFQTMFAAVALIVGIIAAVAYIVAFYRSKKRLEQTQGDH